MNGYRRWAYENVMRRTFVAISLIFSSFSLTGFRLTNGSSEYVMDSAFDQRECVLENADSSNHNQAVKLIN